jgi:NAD(P)-dependent dehydrogenase (short-subunit alcohol dehydrogenase family)
MTDIALITGASRGIGREVARQLAGHGMTVIAAVRDPGRAAESLRGLAGAGGPGEVRPVPLDVTHPGSIRAAAATVEAEYGRLDVLVNNAGVSLEHGRSPLEVDVDTVRRTYETNVFGVIAVTQAFLPLLRRSAAGRVVNVSSSMGSLTEWSDPQSPQARFAPPLLAYNTSKTALNAVTVIFALALRDTGVTVNAADPGYVATDLNGHRGQRTVAEGAQAIVRLAADGLGGRTGTFASDSGPVRW